MPWNIDNRAVNSFAKQSFFMPFHAGRMMQDKDRQPNFLGRRAEARLPSLTWEKITIIKLPAQEQNLSSSSLRPRYETETGHFCSWDESWSSLLRPALPPPLSTLNHPQGSEFRTCLMWIYNVRSSPKQVAMMIWSKESEGIYIYNYIYIIIYI